MVRQAHHEGRLSLTLALSQRERGLAPSATPRCTVHYRAPSCHSECSEESTPRAHGSTGSPRAGGGTRPRMSRGAPAGSDVAPTPPQIATSAARLLATTVASVPSLRGETKERQSQTRLRPHAGLHEAVVSVYTGGYAPSGYLSSQTSATQPTVL